MEVERFHQLHAKFDQLKKQWLTTENIAQRLSLLDQTKKVLDEANDLLEKSILEGLSKKTRE